MHVYSYTTNYIDESREIKAREKTTVITTPKYSDKNKKIGGHFEFLRYSTKITKKKIFYFMYLFIVHTWKYHEYMIGIGTIRKQHIYTC